MAGLYTVEPVAPPQGVIGIAPGLAKGKPGDDVILLDISSNIPPNSVTPRKVGEPSATFYCRILLFQKFTCIEYSFSIFWQLSKEFIQEEVSGISRKSDKFEFTNFRIVL